MSQVSLDIFGYSGTQDRNSLFRIMQPGEHSVLWNCPTCPSGVYFVRMRAGGQTLHREMLLLK